MRNRKKEKGDIGIEKEREKKEGEKLEKLEAFFSALYDFLSDFENFDVSSYFSIALNLKMPRSREMC